MKIRTLTPEYIEGVLNAFQFLSLWVFGEHLTSEQFYQRYCKGEFDHPAGAAWASYIEALDRLPTKW